MNSYSSSNPVAIDSPFVKMLTQYPPLAFEPGIPPIPSQLSGKLNQDYVIAGNILGLSSKDSYFVACRIRHLSNVVRNSRFRESANWRSYLPQLDALNPVMLNEVGLVNPVSNNNKFSFTLQKTSEPFAGSLKWTIEAAGRTPNISVSINKEVIDIFNTPLSPIYPIEGSGYTIQYSNRTGSGDPVSFSATLVLPYSGDCMSILRAIRGNRELVSRLTADKPDYRNAIFDGDCAEDAIAAFILALDES